MEKKSENNSHDRLSSLIKIMKQRDTCQIDATCAGAKDKPTMKQTWFPNIHNPTQNNLPKSGLRTNSVLVMNYVTFD